MVTAQSNQYDSSTVKSSAYNYEHKVLIVHFDHASYVYEGVEFDDYNAFWTAESQGKALNEFIKSKYNGVKINDIAELKTDAAQ